MAGGLELEEVDMQDTHIEFPVYKCEDCGRTGFKDIKRDLPAGEVACKGCGSRRIKELEDKS